MDWQHLPTLISIAKHGNLSAAARELGVNHSTVFRRLKSLEESIGARLFERYQEGYSLTTIGENILSKAKTIEGALAELERSVLGQDTRPSGIIRLTAPPNIAETFLPAYLTDFQNKYPEIRLELLVSNEHYDLSRREADIAIRATKTPPDYLIATLLSQVPWSLHASKAFIREHGEPQSLEDIHRFPLIGAEGELALLPGFQWMKKQYSERIKTKANSLNVMSYLAEAGMGIALLPQDQIRSGLITLSLRTEIEASQWWLLTHPDLRNSERIKLFKAHLIEAIKQDPRLDFSL